MMVGRVLGRSETNRLRRSQPSTTAAAAAPAMTDTCAGVPPSLGLLEIPDDVLWLVIQHLTRVPASSGDCSPGFSCVDRAGYAQGVRLAGTCRAIAERFYSSLDALALPSVASLNDGALNFMARHAGSATKRLVLRNCTRLTDASVFSMAMHMKSLRSIDLSFIANITDSAIVELCDSVGSQLEKLLLRKCENITDHSLFAIARCTNLRTLDLSHLGQGISDAGMLFICRGCGPALRLLSISHNPRLTDDTFVAVGMYCRHLEQLCARNLPLVSDAGFEVMCRGVGSTVVGLDIIDCCSLTKDSVVRAMRKYCTHIQLIDPESHSLRYVMCRVFYS
jgi:hypothetical protein